MLRRVDARSTSSREASRSWSARSRCSSSARARPRSTARTTSSRWAIATGLVIAVMVTAVGAHLRRALQPRRDARLPRHAPDPSGLRGALLDRPVRRRGAGRAAAQVGAARRAAPPYGAPAMATVVDSGQGRRRRGDADVLPGVGGLRVRGRSARHVRQGRGPRDRRRDRHGNADGLRADGRRDEPGARLRARSSSRTNGRTGGSGTSARSREA